jgi:hypothetical protein
MMRDFYDFFVAAMRLFCRSNATFLSQQSVMRGERRERGERTSLFTFFSRTQALETHRVHTGCVHLQEEFVDFQLDIWIRQSPDLATHLAIPDA